MAGWSKSRLGPRRRGGWAGAAIAFALLASPAGAAEKVKSPTS